MSKKSVVVTGGAGFIGSHIVKLFSQKGWHVTVLDWNENPVVEKYADRIAPFDFYGNDAYRLFVDEMPDAVVHCAGYISVPESVAKPAEYYENNVSKTMSMISDLSTLRKKPVLVFSSSAGVYGVPEHIPVSEQAPLNPISPYGQTKAMIEQALLDTYKATKMPFAALRYFNACGADLDGELGQRPGAPHIIARLIEAKKNKTEFTLYGDDYNTPDGTCIRDYIHVQDIAQAHYDMVEYLMHVGCGWILNIGTGKGYSNLEVIEAVKKMIGHFDYNVAERRSGDPDTLIADATKIHDLVKWEPKHSDLNTIIKTAWEWYNGEGFKNYPPIRKGIS